jgi:hypothetical protein
MRSGSIVLELKGGTGHPGRADQGGTRFQAVNAAIVAAANASLAVG